MREIGRVLTVVAISLAAVTISVTAEAQMLMATGSYTGNGSDDRQITGLGGKPDLVILKGNANKTGVICTSSMSGDQTKDIWNTTALEANLIQSLDPDGFTVGNDDRVNGNTVTYYWVAFKDAAGGEMKLGSYVGDGQADHDVTGIGFQPGCVV